MRHPCSRNGSRLFSSKDPLFSSPGFFRREMFALFSSQPFPSRRSFVFCAPTLSEDCVRAWSENIRRLTANVSVPLRLTFWFDSYQLWGGSHNHSGSPQVECVFDIGVTLPKVLLFYPTVAHIDSTYRHPISKRKAFLVSC